MLWDIIRDFFVQYVFGGFDSAENWHAGSIGYLMSDRGDGFTDTSGLMFPIGKVVEEEHGGEAFCYLSMGDWLSTTATIIVLGLLVFAAIRLVVWLAKYVGGLVALRRA